MTYREAFEVLNGVELMVLNRNFDDLQNAIMQALFLLDREAKKEEQHGSSD